MLSAADIAHGYLIVVNLGDIVGERVAADCKFVAIEDKLLLGEDIADIHLHILIPRLLDLRHATSHRTTFHQNLKDLRTFHRHTLA